MEVAVLEKEISGFIGKLLRDNFGRGPVMYFVPSRGRSYQSILRIFYQRWRILS